VGDAAGTEVNAINLMVFGMSDLGRVRKNNEDNFALCNLTTGEVGLAPGQFNHRLGPRGTLLLVADGMGGEACGEIASQICTTTVPKRLYENLKSVEIVNETKFVLLLREAIEFANQIIFQKAQSSPAYRGMGTTTTAAALFGPYLFVAQVGDSRAYVARNKQAVQVTRDQTFLNYLAEIGAEVPVDPEKDSRKSILTQAVGTSEKVDVKITYTKMRQGDRVLLCSDGLYNMVKLPDMLGIIHSEGTPATKCRLLIEKANESGGTDNITAIMAELTGPGLPPTDAGAIVDAKEFHEEDLEPQT
jgi:protein phosphatase